MMAATHAAFSITFASLVLGTADPLALAIAGLSSQLPDVDTSKSRVGRLLFPISRRLENRFAHRTVTHSFLSTAALALVAWPLTIWLRPLYWRAAVWGYLLGWFADAFTKSGVTAFWPYTGRFVIPANPRVRLATGSPAEWVVFGVLIALAAAVINMNLQGGLMRSFVHALGNPQGAVQIFQEEGADHLVYARILKGYDTATLQPVFGEFEIVQALGAGELLLTDGDRFFAGGSNIDSNVHITRVLTHIGPPIRVTVDDLTPDFEFVDDLLLPYRDRRAYISGQLRLEDTYDLTTIPDAGTYPVVRLQPIGDGQAIAHLESATPATVVDTIGSYFAIEGQLLIRTLEVID